MVVASQFGHRLPALTADEDRALGTTPTEALLALPLLVPETISERSVLSGAVIPGARHERRNMVASRPGDQEPHRQGLSGFPCVGGHNG